MGDAVLADEAGNKRVEEQMPVFEHMNDTLQPFLGKPLTLRLISQIQAAVTAHYRALGRPFVAVAPSRPRRVEALLDGLGPRATERVEP